MIAFDLHAGYGDFTLAARAAWETPIAALFGASGSGKSTILEALAGLRPEVCGEITLNGRPLQGLPPEQRRLGWVPQDAALFPHLTVRGNLEFAARARELRSRGATGRRALAHAAGDGSASAVTCAPDATGDSMVRAIDALEIGALLKRRVDALSGGERQRVAIARALASAPELLLLDEPLASVDRPLRARIIPFLAELPARTGVPVLLVSHDPLEVRALASHVVVLSAGEVVAQGDPRDVLAAATALGNLEAFAAENRFDVSVLQRGPGTLSLSTTRGCRLEMAAIEGFPEPTRVAVRAEDILLASAPPGHVSAQNVMAGRVTLLESLGRHVLVHATCGDERFVARVTERASSALRLEPDRQVFLLIKAHSVLALG